MRQTLLITWLLVAIAQPLAAATDTALIRMQEGTAALLRGKYDQAVLSFGKALNEPDLPSERIANIHNDRGVAHWRLAQYEEALKDFNRSIELSNSSAATYNNRANVLIELGRYQEALGDLDRAISLAPAYGAAYNNRGNANFQLGRQNEALNDYRRAIELMPANAVPYNGRAQVQELLGRPYSGLRYITRAITLNGKYTAAYRNRAIIYQRLEREEDALGDYERLINLSPDDADLYIGRGQVYLSQEKTVSALKDFTKAIELDPQNALGYAGRGATQNARKRYDEALTDLDQAVVLDPKLAEAYYRRGETYFYLNDFERANADLTKAAELASNYAEVYDVRGKIAEAQENKDAAIAAYKQALEFDPFLESAMEALKKLSGQEERPLQPIAETVKGWEILSPFKGRYVAVNSTYPKLKVLLEMHGSGDPAIIDWTPLSDYLRNFGLLRYSAGRMSDNPNEKGHYEFVAIIDLRRESVVSIEPFLAGTTEAKWDWSKTGVVVTDAEGVISAHELRAPPKPKPEPQPVQERPWYEDDQGAGERRRPRGLFDWLFN